MITPPRATGAPFKRLFFALDCTAEQRQAISRWRKTLALGQGRKVPSEHFHLTLLFLGEVPLERLPSVFAAADSVRPPGENLRVPLDRLETWHRSGVLVLAPQTPPKALLRLAYDLEQALQPMGLRRESRDYRPHLTLARDFRGQAPEATTPPELWLNAHQFTLFESRKGHYLPLQHWSLT